MTTKPMKIPHRHVFKVTILAAMVPENKAMMDGIADFAARCLQNAKDYALVKCSVESNDLFVDPLKQ